MTWLPIAAAAFPVLAGFLLQRRPLGGKGREPSRGTRIRRASTLDSAACMAKGELRKPQQPAGGASSGRRSAPTATEPLGAAPAVMGSGAVVVAWSIAVSVVVAVERATCDWPPFQRMLALILAVLLSMKAVVGAASRTPLSLPRWLLFCCWAGMDPRTFAVRAPRAGAGRLGREGLRHAALGVVVLALARLVPLGGLGTECAVFVGSSLVVHFGAFTLQAALLRAVGYPAERLFRAPWRSRSLAEFWGQRWNLGFVEMTAIVLHRPLRRRLGCKRREGSRAARDPGLRALGDGACTSGPSGPGSPSDRAGGASAGRRSAPTATKPLVAAPAALRTSCAIAVAFLFSGLLHECAITLPIHAGHGGPLAYFAWQGAAVCLEPRLRVRGPAWTLACLLLPLPLLFPAPFRAMVTGVLVG